MENVPSLSGNHQETYIKISDSLFIENKGINFAPVIVGLWKDGIIRHNNIYERNEITYEQFVQESNGFAHFIQDYHSWPLETEQEQEFAILII